MSDLWAYDDVKQNAHAILERRARGAITLLAFDLHVPDPAKSGSLVTASLSSGPTTPPT